MLRRTPIKRTPLKRKAPTKKPGSSRAKRDSVSTWKKKADAIVSRYVRFTAADHNGLATCYTCGRVAPWQALQCGHFVSRNNSATRYDMNNLRVQCAGCNIWGRGRYDVYADKLMTELGTVKFKALLKKGRSIYQLTVGELKDICERYKI